MSDTPAPATNPLRDAILAADDQPLKEIEVPEWGITVYLKPFSGAEIDEWELKAAPRLEAGGDAIAGIRSLLLSLSLTDAKGERIFTPNDVDALQKKNGRAIKRLFAMAQDLNGIGLSSVQNEKKD